MSGTTPDLPEDDDMSGLAALYALDALDPAERAEFEAHLQRRPDLRDEVAGFQAAAAELSTVTAEIDHVLAQSQPPTEYDHAVVAAHLRGLLSGEGDLRNDAFLERYRPLLQLNPELASAHGQLRSLLKEAPTESANEAERLHARHQWAARAKHKNG